VLDDRGRVIYRDPKSIKPVDHSADEIPF
jgi:hypothetical protein